MYTTLWVLWDADFRCFWVTLSCFATSVFVEKKTKKLLKTQKRKKINLGFPALLTALVWHYHRLSVYGMPILSDVLLRFMLYSTCVAVHSRGDCLLRDLIF